MLSVVSLAAHENRLASDGRVGFSCAFNAALQYKL